MCAALILVANPFDVFVLSLFGFENVHPCSALKINPLCFLSSPYFFPHRFISSVYRRPFQAVHNRLVFLFCIYDMGQVYADACFVT